MATQDIAGAKARLGQLLGEISAQKRVVSYYKSMRLSFLESGAKSTLLKLAKKAAALQAVIEQAEKKQETLPD